MRNLVAGVFVSLDGVVELPEQSIQSILACFNDEVVQVVQSDQDESDTILQGGRTYQESAAYWPDTALRTTHCHTKLVVSKALETVEWQNTALSAGGVVDQATTIKRVSRRPARRLNEPRIGGPADVKQ